MSLTRDFTVYKREMHFIQVILTCFNIFSLSVYKIILSLTIKLHTFPNFTLFCFSIFLFFYFKQPRKCSINNFIAIIFFNELLNKKYIQDMMSSIFVSLIISTTDTKFSNPIAQSECNGNILLHLRRIANSMQYRKKE